MISLTTFLMNLWSQLRGRLTTCPLALRQLGLEEAGWAVNHVVCQGGPNLCECAVSLDF